MDAPFEVGDTVECVRQPVSGRLTDGKLYTITSIVWDEDWYVTVEEQGSTNFYADRFILSNTTTYRVTPVIRKIKQLETRFQQRVAR